MIEGLNQDKSTVSCVNRRVLHTLKLEQTTRVPPWQAIGGKTSTVGAPGSGFRRIRIRDSTDLDNMIFSMGSTIIFGSWIYETSDDGKLQGHLLEDSDHHQDFFMSATTTDQLAERFAQITM